MPGTSSRLRPQLPAIHPKHAEPSRSRTWIAWKSVEEGARILAWVVATTRYWYVQHTALFLFVLQPILTLAHRLYRQVPCQTPQSHELCNPYGFSHAQVSNRPLPILPFTAILYVAIKEQPDVTSRQSNSFALVCNWLIGKQSVHDPIPNFLIFQTSSPKYCQFGF